MKSILNKIPTLGQLTQSRFHPFLTLVLIALDLTSSWFSLGRFSNSYLISQHFNSHRKYLLLLLFMYFRVYFLLLINPKLEFIELLIVIPFRVYSVVFL